MQTKKEFINEYKTAFPIHQSRNTGKYGFERILDSLNLNKCSYKTKRSAQLARTKQATFDYGTYIAYYAIVANTFTG